MAIPPKVRRLETVMTIETSICAKYKNVDGWHIFESDAMPGLYVASKDAEAAYADVGPSIELLFKLDEGIDCKATPELSYREFVAAMKPHHYDRDMSLVLSDKRFFVTGAMA